MELSLGFEVDESGMLDDKDDGSSPLLTIFTVVIAESELPLSSVTSVILFCLAGLSIFLATGQRQ